MEAHEYKLGNVIVLELKGRVDEFNTKVLGDELRTIINTGRFSVVIDLGKVGFLSAHCLRELWRYQRKAQAFGGDIVLVGAEGEVLETIHYVELDKVVKRFYAIEEAVEFFRTKPPLESSDSSDEKFFSWWGSLRPWMSRQGLRKMLRIFSIGTLVLVTFSSGIERVALAASNDNAAYSIEEVMNLARETSPAVKLARLKMAEREAEVQMARSWGLPRLVGTGGYLYQSNPSVLSDVVNREINNVRQQGDEVSSSQLQTRSRVNFTKDAALVGLGFSQVIYSAGLFENQIGLREAQKREADAQVAVESLAVEEQVRSLFLGLLLAREKLSFLKAHQEALAQRAKAAQRAYRMKTISAIQFSEIELLGLKASQEMLSAEKDEQTTRGLLNILLGRPIEAAFVPIPTDMKSDFKLESPEHYFDIALHRYPELRRSVALIDSAASYQRVVEAQSTFSPQALVFGSSEYSYGLGAPRRDVSWSLGIGFYVPLYDGRKSNGEWSKAVSLSSQARLSYEAAERKLRVDINEAVSEIRRVRLQRELADKAYDIATRKRAEAREAVREGQIPQYRMSEVFAQELEAKMAVLAAQAEFFRWRTRLLLLTGQREI
jgi:anti-anti-sigma factor